MNEALRIYQRASAQLVDDNLTWKDFDDLVQRLIQETEGSIGEEEIPWHPRDVIVSFANVISKRRKEASAAWIESVESETATMSSMSVSDANRLHIRGSEPPAVLTDLHAKRLKRTLHSIETRFDALKIEWLVEKFKELSPTLCKKFLELVSGN